MIPNQQILHIYTHAYTARDTHSQEHMYRHVTIKTYKEEWRQPSAGIWLEGVEVDFWSKNC